MKRPLYRKSVGMRGREEVGSEVSPSAPIYTALTSDPCVCFTYLKKIKKDEQTKSYHLKHMEASESKGTSTAGNEELIPAVFKLAAVTTPSQGDPFRG